MITLYEIRVPDLNAACTERCGIDSLDCFANCASDDSVCLSQCIRENNECNNGKKQLE